MDGGSMRLFVNLASPTGLPTTEITFADLAKSAGYKTALIGSLDFLLIFFIHTVHAPVLKYGYELDFKIITFSFTACTAHQFSSV